MTRWNKQGMEEEMDGVRRMLQQEHVRLDASEAEIEDPKGTDGRLLEQGVITAIPPNPYCRGYCLHPDSTQWPCHRPCIGMKNHQGDCFCGLHMPEPVDFGEDNPPRRRRGSP